MLYHSLQGRYIADIFCARTDESAESNAVTAILQVNAAMGVARCLCYVVVPNEQAGQLETVTCGLFVTQCPIQYNIQTTVVVP